MGEVMRRLTIVILAGSLLAITSGAAAAQKPSASPPPWIGGRVEMPEHGFAVTVPDGWVAFDPAGDVDEQIRSAFVVLDPDAPVDEVREMAEVLSLGPDVGAQLLLLEDSMEASCVFQVGSAPKVGLAEFADFVSAHLADYDYVTDTEPPRSIDLPAGPGHLVAATLTMPDGLGPRALVYQLVEGDRSLLVVVCNGDERPVDDWLSIAETWE